MQLPAEPTHTVGAFVELFHELTNGTCILLKVVPAAIHLFVKEGWFSSINCGEDNSVFVIKDKHIYNYIQHTGAWWKLDTVAGICEPIHPLHLGLGISYCLIPVRRVCIEGFMEILKRWRPADAFYQTVQAGIIVYLYEEGKVVAAAAAAAALAESDILLGDEAEENLVETIS